MANYKNCELKITQRFMNFLAQWTYNADGNGGGSYPRSSKSNSKFYVSVEH